MMKLWQNPASPFVNKTRIVIQECGLADKIELIEIVVAPGNPNREFGEQNPLRMIPTLVLEDGTKLHDSLNICDYLIRLSGNETMLPTSGDERTNVLQVHAVCNGVTERAVATRYETFARPEEYRWPAMIDDNFDRIENGLAWVNENVADLLSGPFDLSEASFVAMLKYLDFRFETIGWRDKYTALVEPYEAMCEMASVRAVYGD